MIRLAIAINNQTYFLYTLPYNAKNCTIYLVYDDCNFDNAVMNFCFTCWNNMRSLSYFADTEDGETDLRFGESYRLSYISSIDLIYGKLL